MLRSWLALPLCLASGCAETFEDRVAELDARVEVQCGLVWRCGPAEHAESVVACLESNLAAGIGATATIEIHIDPVDIVYALDGSYVSLWGYYPYGEGPEFTESRCGGVETIVYGTCATARTTDCERIRNWNE